MPFLRPVDEFRRSAEPRLLAEIFPDEGMLLTAPFTHPQIITDPSYGGLIRVLRTDDTRRTRMEFTDLADFAELDEKERSGYYVVRARNVVAALTRLSDARGVRKFDQFVHMPVKDTFSEVSIQAPLNSAW